MHIALHAILLLIRDPARLLVRQMPTAKVKEFLTNIQKVSITERYQSQHGPSSLLPHKPSEAFQTK